jgi:hypothetical protein
MVRIKIKDLPKDKKISKEEMRRVLGGIGTWPTPEKSRFQTLPWFRDLNIETIPLPE